MKRIIKLVDEIYKKTDECGVCITLKVWKFRSGNKETIWDLTILPEGEDVELTTFDSFQKLTDYAVLVKGV